MWKIYFCFCVDFVVVVFVNFCVLILEKVCEMMGWFGVVYGVVVVFLGRSGEI